MALKHAQPLEVIALHDADRRGGEPVSSSLLKTSSLQLMRVVLPAGQALPEHRVPGELTVQCLEGEATLSMSGRTCRLRAGELVVLPGGEAHAVRAHADSMLLLTLVRGLSAGPD